MRDLEGPLEAAALSALDSSKRAELAALGVMTELEISELAAGGGAEGGAYFWVVAWSGDLHGGDWGAVLRRLFGDDVASPGTVRNAIAQVTTQCLSVFFIT